MLADRTGVIVIFGQVSSLATASHILYFGRKFRLETLEQRPQCTAATFHSVSFSKTNLVWFGKITPKKCEGFSKPIPVWFGKKKIDFARRIFQSKFRLAWKILMTIVNVLKIPNQIQFGLEKSLTITNTLNLEPFPALFCKISF